VSSNPLISGANTPVDPQWLGIYNAIVVNANDPLNQGRVQLQVPQVLGNAISNWATSMQTGTSPPAIGTQVFVQFLGGNPNNPYFSEGLSTNVIQSVTSDTSTVINDNAFFVGGSLDGWVAVNGTITATQPNPNTSPPYGYGCLLTISGTNGGYIQESGQPFIATPGNSYSISAWVYYPAGGLVNIGAAFNDSGDVPQINDVTVVASTWTQIEFTVTAPAGCTNGYPLVGPFTSNNGDLFTAEAVTVSPQIDGNNITDGTIPATAVAFTAQDIGGVAVTINATGTPPASPNVGDLWFDGTNGYVLDSWNGSSWVPYTFGTNALQAGSITTSLLAANAVVASTIAAGAIDGMVINGVTINGNTVSGSDLIATGAEGGFFAYTGAGGGNVVITETTSGSWTCPTGVTSIKVECWGGGGAGAAGAVATGAGGGGGGGEYACEPTLTVTPGNMYNFVVGAAGANSTFNSTSVVAHGGSAASGTSGGAGGTGSTNTTHYNGGAGGGGAGFLALSFTSSATGTHTWTAPAGVTSIDVGCWGAGSGGYGGDNVHGGDGGSGGAYAETDGFTVTPLTGYSYTIGTAGAAGSSEESTLPTAGGNTSFNTSACIAVGAGTSGFGGSAASCTGTFAYSGGNCGIQNGSEGAGGGGGGSAAGNTQNGNNGKNTSSSSGGDGGASPPGDGGNGYGGNGGNRNVDGSPAGSIGGGGGGEGFDASYAGHGGNGFIEINYLGPGSSGGGGGGSSASLTAAGNASTTNTGSGAGAGGAGGTDQGAGGAGGADTHTGTAGGAPGAGGGGGGSTSSSAGGAGSPGQVRITYTAVGASSLVASAAGESGSDPILSGAVPAGLYGQTTLPLTTPAPSTPTLGPLLWGDGRTAATNSAARNYAKATDTLGNISTVGMMTFNNNTTGDQGSFSTGSYTALTGLSGISVGEGVYHILGSLCFTNTNSSNNHNIKFQGSNNTGSRVIFTAIPSSGVTNTIENFQLISNTNSSFGATAQLDSGSACYLNFQGILSFTAADTFGFMIEAGSGAGLTIKGGSWFTMWAASS
jgi:hypothetical protein